MDWWSYLHSCTTFKEICIRTSEEVKQCRTININPHFAPQGRLVACLLSLLQLMEEDHFKNIWDRMTRGSPANLKTFLLECFLLFNVLITQPIFPHSWNAMRLLTSHVLLNTMQELAKPLLIYFRSVLRIYRLRPFSRFEINFRFVILSIP